MPQFGHIFELHTAFSGNIMMSWKLCTACYISKEKTLLYKNIFKGIKISLLIKPTDYFKISFCWDYPTGCATKNNGKWKNALS